MKPGFVNTQNARKLLAGLKALDQRGAAEACLLVVDGPPGLGKTTTVHWWTVQSGALFLRAKKEWTPAWFMRELLGLLRVDPPHSFEKMFAQAVAGLARAEEGARLKGRQMAVVVDEVDHICRSERILETIRDLSDALEIPFLLVGMGRVRTALARYPQVSSRIAQWVEFDAASLDDVQAMVSQLCEVPVDPGLTAFLWTASRGRFREVKEGIASIERFGRRAGGELVTAKAMRGELLMNDRGTGKPILVEG